MAGTITFKLEISDKFKRNLDPTKTLASMQRDFLEKATGEMHALAVEAAPEDRGVLKQDHHITIDASPLPRWGMVSVDNETAIFVHNGTRPHFPPLRSIMGWAQRRGINPYALQRSIGRHGTRPNPWFMRSAETIRKRMPKYAHDAGLNIRTRWNR